MPTIIMDKKEILYLIDILNKNGLPDFESILNKDQNPNDLLNKTLTIYLQSILTASDKPAWIDNPDSSSISKLLNDGSDL